MVEYNFNVNVYKSVPTGLCKIDDLLRIGRDRLKLYNIFEQLELLPIKTHTEEWNLKLEQQLQLNQLNNYVNLLRDGDFASRKEDHIAHWLVSMVYCKTEELEEIFVKWEKVWFHSRYQKLKISDREIFLSKNGYRFEAVDPETLVLEKDKFLGCNRSLYLTWYKAPFEKLKGVIASKLIYLENGLAFFIEEDIIEIIKYDLEGQFKDSLNFTKKVDIEDERVIDILAELNYVSERISTHKLIYTISTDNIDRVAIKHFPPCMQAIHNLLRREHHLKYGCKMQYGLFLKNIGMPYQEALSFWENEFTRKIPIKRYNQKYVYLFKHQYGKVGGKINYLPDSCDTIIDKNPLPTEHHGCPFRHWDRNRLLRLLENSMASDSLLLDIEDLVSKGYYRHACTKYFNAKSIGVASLNLVTSPVEYTLESMRLGFEPDNCLDMPL